MGITRTESAAVTSEALGTQLLPEIQGEVFTPNDPGYDEARMAWNLSVDQYPAVIVQAKNAADIVEAIRFARQANLGIAVQATGHGVARPADGCLLIVTSGMNGVRVDADAQTAWVEAGVKWGPVLEKAQAAGLAPLLGSSPDVGAVGYTLGGGMGWLARKYGLSTDSVRYFELVTLDGRILRASETENSDLFWGLRGGGGSFGVITGMEIKLYPVTSVYGGNLLYPIEQAKAVYTRYREWIEQTPEELTSSIAIMNFPPMEVFPEPLRGKSFVIVRGCYCGPIEGGEALMRYWREWQAPAFDQFRAMSFSEVATISNDPIDPVPGLSSGAWLRELSDEAIDTIIQYGVSKDGSSPFVVTEVRHAGGAITRVSERASAYGNREAPLVLQVIAMTPTPEIHQRAIQYTGQFKRDLGPYLTGGVYINFLEGDEKRRRTKDSFSEEAYRRLRALKARYDPENRLSFGFDIPPEGSNVDPNGKRS